jgi:hypothetical protein
VTDEDLRAPRILVATVALVAVMVIGAPPAHALDPFEIQVYDGTVNQPFHAGAELHVNSVLSGRRDATPPELPPHHQSHFTLEPSLGITDWWEVGAYLQSALLADGSFEYAGNKLRTKFVLPRRAESPFGWGVNLEVSRIPERYDRSRWGAEIRPIATWTSPGNAVYASVNPILDVALAGPDRGEAPSLEPAATICYVREGLLSIGLEYYASLGPIGTWLPAAAQEHYLFEVINVLRWKRVELNAGIGEGLTDASNGFVGKMILGVK